MSSFTSEPAVSPHPTKPHFWVLLEAFHYDLYAAELGWRLKVPKGFETNFASSPRVLWSIIPPWGRYGKAAIVHDYLYNSQIVTRRVADAIFLDAMEVLRVPWWKRQAMFRAVRVFGGRAWRRAADVPSIMNSPVEA